MATDAPVSEVLAALPLPALVVNAEQRIVAINEAAEDMLGQGALDRHFVTVLRQPEVAEAVEGALADRSPRSAVYLRSGQGIEQTFDVSITALNTQGRVMVCFLDTTREAQAEQMRRDFVANVSHELRTPLTSLLGFIETLTGAAREDPAARDRFLGIMADEAGRMNRLVGDLLSLSRVEADARVKPATRIELIDVLHTALRNLAPLAADSAVRLQSDFDPAPLPMIGDADQLLQVFTNLIENAIKYGGPDQTVRIAIDRQDRDPALRGPGVRVTVTDEGPGIDPVHVPRLTERFYRADNHRSRALGGTGLGLAIVKHILSRHRGRLKITSELGQGAAFTVILPILINDQDKLPG